MDDSICEISAIEGSIVDYSFQEKDPSSPKPSTSTPSKPAANKSPSRKKMPKSTLSQQSSPKPSTSTPSKPAANKSSPKPSTSIASKHQTGKALPSNKKQQSSAKVLCGECGILIHCRSIKKHNDSMHFKKTMKCSECKKEYRSNSDLKAHLKAAHGIQNKHQCNVCSAKYVHKRNLLQHMKKHSVNISETSAKSNVCHCGKQFARKCHLIDHKHVHTFENKFICEKCDKSYKFRTGLLKHTKKQHHNQS